MLAKWIIDFFPDHTHYVEPYFGGGAVLLRKPMTLVDGHSEVVNDRNGLLMNFWRCLAHPKTCGAMRMLLQGTPFCEDEFNAAKDRLAKAKPCQSCFNVNLAADFFIVARQSRQGLMKDFATLSRRRTRRGMNEQAAQWLSAVEGLPEIHERLKGVVILNRPAIDVIRQQDGEETLFYLDPPYHPDTRSSGGEYGENEMDHDDHAELLDALSKIEGKFILSGYDCPLYEYARDEYGWFWTARHIPNHASSSSKKEIKTECLWMNFLPGEVNDRT
jgi:DNA adenine methylase